MKNTIITLTSFFTLTIAGNAQINLLTNGDFENGVSSWVNDTSIINFKSVLAPIYGITTSVDGTNYLDTFDGGALDGFYTFSQYFTVASSDSYNFGISISGQNGPTLPVSIDIFDATNSIVASSNSANAVFDTWSTLSGSSNLTPGTYSFRVNAHDAAGYDAAFVNVPEPSSTALLGLGALALLSRRKR